MTVLAVFVKQIIYILLYLMLFWITPLPILYPLIGMLIFITSKNRLAIIINCIVVGFVGSLLSYFLLNPATFEWLVKNMPRYANVDVPFSIYGDIYSTLVVNKFTNHINIGLQMLLSLTFISITGIVLSYLKKKYIKYIKYSALALIVISFAVVSYNLTSNFRQTIAHEPADYSFGYDPVIYLKTYYKMKTQKNYYKAIADAASKDFRLNREKTVIDGKFKGFFYSPLLFREPYTFYFWQIVAPFNAKGVYYFFVLSGIFILSLSYFTSNKIMGDHGDYAIFTPVLVYPYILISSSWLNIFFPDWLASIFLTAGLLLFFSRKYLFSAICMFLAAIFREVTFAWLLLLLAVLLIQRRKEVKYYAILAVAKLIIFIPHYFTSQNYMILENKGLSSLATAATLFRGFNLERFLSTSSYMMFFYGYFIFPTIIIVLISLIGFGIIFNKSNSEWKFGIFIGVFTIFHLWIATSSYWGQHIWPTILFAFSITVCWLFKKLEKYEADGAIVKPMKTSKGSKSKNRSKRKLKRQTI